MRHLMTLLVFSSVLFGSYTAQAQDDEGEVFSRDQLFPLIMDMRPPNLQFALPEGFVFPKHTRDNSLFGVDFSHHNEENCNCTPDWSALYDMNVRFAYLKASQGLSYRDYALIPNVVALRKFGKMPFGFYHFLSSNKDPAKQADNFLAVYDQAGGSQLPSSLDLEWHAGPMQNDCPTNATLKIKHADGRIELKCDQWYLLDGSEIIKKANIWLDLVKVRTGVVPLIYTNNVWWESRIGKAGNYSDLHAKFLWIADYSKEGRGEEVPATPNASGWTLWQFTEKAKVVSGSDTVTIDANIFDGTFDKFKNFFGIK